MPVRYDIKIDSSEVGKGLRRLERAANSLEPALDEIGDYIVSEVAFNFRDSHDPYGKPWKKLADATIKQRRNNSNVPLVDKGILRDDITHNVGRNHVAVGSNLEYAATHQAGSPKRNIDARPFLPIESRGLPDAWENEVLGIVNGYLQRAIG